MNAPHESAAAAQRGHLLDLDADELRAWLAARGEPAFRATQILDWIYVKRVTDFDAMTNLSKPLRAALAEQAMLYAGRVEAESVAADGTRKLLLRWPDGATVETVWIPEGDRHTACVSSQVGCPVGCVFCASGLDGVVRNLTAGEIVEQTLCVAARVAQHAPRDADDRPARLSNLVFMGMGEPLANYDAVVKALRLLNAPWGLNFGARRITVSTVGLPKQIRRLADEGLQVNLALSLHAADPALRQELIPWGNMPLEKLLDACRYFFARTGREITLEYVLLEDVNMSAADAAKLAGVARRLRCNVNLLRYNPVAGLPFRRPSSAAAHQFQQELRSRGINAHIRTSRGPDVDAACGQLRRRTTT